MLSSSTWRRVRRQRKPLPPARAAVLESRVAYYACLPEAERAELRGLVQVLLGEWSFEPGAGLPEVDEAMRVIVAGHASLALFGRPLSELPRVRAVILYPGDYRAREERLTPEGTRVTTSEVRTGEAWQHGVLVFSWDEVAYDAVHVNDGRNVVVHEMAHALDAQTGAMNGVPPQPDAAAASHWRDTFGLARRQAKRDLRLGRRRLFDAYDADSPAEFFAASTEAFLEAPGALAEGFPEVSAMLGEYLHLDPNRWAACLGETSRS